MGGMIGIVARYEDGGVDTFKTSTNFFNDRFNTPNILKESWLKAKIIKYDMLRDNHLSEEEFANYDSRKGIKAPYEYGIILIDYLYKKLFSFNNYNGMITGNSASLLEQYEMLVNQNFEMQLTSKGNTKILDLKETRLQDLCEVHFIHKALQAGAIILKNEVVVFHNGTIESVVGNIYDLKLDNLSPTEQEKIIKETNSKNSQTQDYMFDGSGYADITFQYPDFEFIEGNGAEGCNVVLDYMEKNDFELTPFEKECWVKFLSRYESKEKED